MSEPEQPVQTSDPVQLPEQVDDKPFGYYAKEREKKKQLEAWVIEKKRAFADELYKDPTDPSECSARVFTDPKEARWRIIATTSWTSDEVVLARLSEIGAKPIRDDKEISVEAQCERYLEIYQQSENAKDQVLALSQIDKIKGFDKSASNNITVNNNKIMVVPRALSDAEWAENARKQQERLSEGKVDSRAIEIKQE
jgi:hypothetical protein